MTDCSVVSGEIRGIVRCEKGFSNIARYRVACHVVTVVKLSDIMGVII